MLHCLGSIMWLDWPTFGGKWWIKPILALLSSPPPPKKKNNWSNYNEGSWFSGQMPCYTTLQIKPNSVICSCISTLHAVNHFFNLLNSFALKLLLRTYLPSSLNSFWNQTLYNSEIVTKIIKLTSLLYNHFFITKSTGIVRFYGMNLCVQIIHFER